MFRIKPVKPLRAHLPASFPRQPDPPSYDTPHPSMGRRSSVHSFVYDRNSPWPDREIPGADGDRRDLRGRPLVLGQERRSCRALPQLPEVKLVPDLRTIPVPHDRPAFNVQMVNASLLPRNKEGIWVLDFAFKPLRIRTVDIPGVGRRQVHYLYYKVVNRRANRGCSFLSSSWSTRPAKNLKITSSRRRSR